MARETKPPVSTITKNNLKIIGDNVLYNNGIITAFYCVRLDNYSTASGTTMDEAVQRLVSMISNLTLKTPEVQFTIERIEKVTEACNVRKNLIDTVRMYKPDYDLPADFSKNVKKDIQDYCLLGIDIQQSSLVDVEDYNILETAKELAKRAANTFAGLGNMKIDPEKILKLEENIYQSIRSNCVRASQELVFYNYVSKVYPGFEISYDNNGWIKDTSFEDIIGSVTQTVSDNFGWFELHNEGVDLFDWDPMPTYGCMLDVKAFPPYIRSDFYDLVAMPNVVTTVKCMKKEDATIKLKRTRASDRYEVDQAVEANAEIEQIEATEHNIQVATHAIEGLDNGEIMCQFNTSILVIAETREELKSAISDVVTTCRDNNILVSKSLNQALDFLDVYVNKKPKKFEHMAFLGFPLSFKQNRGVSVGDDSPTINGQLNWSPAIGEDLG